MKKVFTPAIALASILACANVSAEQVILNDFNDGTTQGWDKGGAAEKPLTAETEADGNVYLRLISEGESSTDPDKKIVFQNASGEWRGNYNVKGAQSIISISRLMSNWLSLKPSVKQTQPIFATYTVTSPLFQ